MRTITEIVVHCSATPQNLDIGVKEIRKMHLDRKFADIGYHYVIRRGGIIEHGRPEDQVGAHVEGHNGKSLGICLVGGTDADNKTLAEFNYDRSQMTALEYLIRTLLKKYPDASDGVKGHRDYPGVKKACPCFDVRAWWYGSAPIRKGETS